MADLGLLIIRLVIGLTIIGHGAQKLFGWFGGSGLKKTGQGFEAMGIKPGGLWATAAGLAEFIGGILVAVGFLTTLGSILIIVTMVGAITTVHYKNGFWSSDGGYEYNLVMIAAAVSLALIGAGAYSFDFMML